MIYLVVSGGYGYLDDIMGGYDDLVDAEYAIAQWDDAVQLARLDGKEGGSGMHLSIMEVPSPHVLTVDKTHFLYPYITNRSGGTVARSVSETDPQ